ncbi:ComEC/Rec2 family competence protein, partial [Lacticaseibacillus rhamnosus]
MSGRLILLAAALLAGIMGGIGLWWVLAILLIWLVMKTNRTSFVYVGLFLVIGWGCGRADANQWQNPPQPRGSVTIPASAIKLKDGYVSFIGRAANGIAVSGRGSVSKELAERLASNDQPVQLAGGYEVARLAPARNQFEFDYATYAWQSRQLAYELVKPTLNFSFQPRRQFFDVVDSWRVHLFAYFEQLPNKVRQYAKGLLLGQLDDDFLTQRQAFVDLGVFHLFSISGLHLFALVASLYWLAARLRIPQGLVDGLLLGLLPLFLLLLPLGAGLWRAVWMRLADIINRYLRFGLTGLDLFSMVLMVNLLWQPRVLMTMGGQLTYLMTGLLIGLPALHKWQVNWRLVLGGMPVIAWHTFSFNLLTVFFNWLLMPIFELIIIPGLVFALLMPHAGLTYLFNDALQLLETILIRLSHLPGQII